jgi:molecular chaperone IbpA
MTNLRFPQHHFGIGFDRMFEDLERLMATNQPGGKAGYPPVNVEKVGEFGTCITMAVAGFSESEVDITQQQNVLLVEGRKSEDDVERNYVYRGIAKRNFRQEFVLADHVEVKSASLKDGMLVIDLEKLVPEQHKPKKIPLIKE